MSKFFFFNCSFLLQKVEREEMCWCVLTYTEQTDTWLSDNKECPSVAPNTSLAFFLFHSIPLEMSKIILCCRAVCSSWLLHWVLTSILKWSGEKKKKEHLLWVLVLWHCCRIHCSHTWSLLRINQLNQECELKYFFNEFFKLKSSILFSVNYFPSV